MSSGFITEAEAAEARKKRQEEWDKVRNADDPLEAPEQLFDHRSLFERLQEQKQKRDLEYEEAHKLKNMIKGLDDDEIQFLDLVDRTKLAADRKKYLEDERELLDYRTQVAYLQEKTLDKKLQAEVCVAKPKTVSSNRSSQMKLLKGAVVVKNEPKKRKMSGKEDNEDADRECNKKLKSGANGHLKADKNDVELNNSGLSCTGDPVTQKTDAQKRIHDDHDVGNKKIASGLGMTCIGILPGVGCYNNSSSDSDTSSDTDQTESQCSIQIDLLGRKVLHKDKEKDK